MKMIDILHKFFKAEWTGSWLLHLQAVYEMVPYCAASWHNLYANEAYSYLHMMWELENSHSEVYRQLQEGMHVIRRSDSYWAGLSSDVIIQHVLMRRIKTTVGLTWGQSMTETQRLVWLWSTPACADVNNAIQEFTGVQYTTSEQHQKHAKSRQECEFRIQQIFCSFLLAGVLSVMIRPCITLPLVSQLQVM